MAEKKPKSKNGKRAAKKKPADNFDQFLAERFAELRRELDAHIAAPGLTAKKTGQLAHFPRPAGQLTRGGWKLGIAAVVLAAVAVPMVMQLNQKQAEMKATVSSPAAEQRSEPHIALNKNDAENDEVVAEEEKPAARKSRRAKTDPAKKKIAGRAYEKEAPEAPASDDGAMAYSKRSLPPMADADAAPSPKGESAKVALAPSAPAAPAAEGSEHRAEEASERNNLAAAGAPAEIQSRSAPIADAKFRLKQEEVAAEEKAEMEKLWKEFEKDPEKFRKDAKRTERLKMLLVRHDTRSRAKRLSTK